MNQLIEFIKSCLDECQPLPKNIEKMDWGGLFRFCQEQAISGLAFEWLRVHGEGLKVPKTVLLQWVVLSEQIKQKNWLLNKKAVIISEEYKEAGFKNCILKGQGVALNYPNPLARTPGDIDIWLEGGRERIREYITGKYGEQLERYHHIELSCEDGVDVEVHFTPSYMYNPIMNRRLQRWFKEHGSWALVELPEGAGRIPVPTQEFNMVYLLEHMYRHLFSEGIGLRQVVDYYYLLKSEECRVKSEEFATVLSSTLKDLGLLKFAGAVMWVLHEQLGLKKNYLIALPNEKEGKFLWDEMMIGGNFGKYDTRLGKKANESRLRTFFRMTARNMRFVSHYPSEALCEPLFRARHYLWRKAHGMK